MKIEIKNDKPKLIHLVTDYLIQLMSKREVEMIMNGEKAKGTIDDIQLVHKEEDFLMILIKGKEFFIPILNVTKAVIGTENVFFFTRNHSTVIEFL